MLASSLAFVAGGVNSAGFLAYQYFSANMTGNVSIPPSKVGHMRQNQVHAAQKQT